jgi:hypothetical protein
MPTDVKLKRLFRDHSHSRRASELEVVGDASILAGDPHVSEASLSRARPRHNLADFAFTPRARTRRHPDWPAARRPPLMRDTPFPTPEFYGAMAEELRQLASRAQEDSVKQDLDLLALEFVRLVWRARKVGRPVIDSERENQG